MKERTRNVSITANINDYNGMDIILNESGRLSYLTSVKYSVELFNLIKDGKNLESIRRENDRHMFIKNKRSAFPKRRNEVLQNMITNILNIADGYIDETFCIVA